jgi:hypothetical protein
LLRVFCGSCLVLVVLGLSIIGRIGVTRIINQSKCRPFSEKKAAAKHRANDIHKPFLRLAAAAAAAAATASKPFRLKLQRLKFRGNRLKSARVVVWGPSHTNAFLHQMQLCSDRPSTDERRSVGFLRGPTKRHASGSVNCRKPTAAAAARTTVYMRYPPVRSNNDEQRQLCKPSPCYKSFFLLSFSCRVSIFIASYYHSCHSRNRAVADRPRSQAEVRIYFSI